MITKSIRNSMKKQEGQALVLACLMMIVLAVAVITTVNLGHNVIERTKLQNSADAAAYSMAAQEARAFNFYAFANRTQVSHYVTAMTLHSFNSMLFAIEAWLVDFFGFIKSSIGLCSKPKGLFWKAACTAIKLIPYVGQVIAQIINIITQVLTTLNNFLAQIFKPLEIADKALGKVVYESRFLNVAMSAATMGVYVMATINQLTGATKILTDNDPNLASGLNSAFSLASGAINKCMFQRAHQVGAGIGKPGILPTVGNPITPLKHDALKDDDPVARAKKSMGQIANATRFAADADNGGGQSPYYVTKRTIATGLLPPVLGSFSGILEKLISLITGKYGQTRLMAHNGMKPKDIAARKSKANKIRVPGGTPGPNGVHWGALASGDMLGADDPYYIGLPSFSIPGFENPFDRCSSGDDLNECWGDPEYDTGDNTGAHSSVFEPSIWATNSDQQTPQNRKGLHFRVVSSPKQDNSWRCGANGGSCPAANANNPWKKGGLNAKDVCVTFGGCPWGIGIEITVYTANIQPVWDNNHQWHGIVPFAHFEPGQYQKDCLSQGDAAALDKISDRPANPNQGGQNAASRSREFNQPSTWVMANKSKDALKNPIADPTASRNDPSLLNTQGELTMGLSGSGTKLKMANDKSTGIGPLSYTGMGVISRGQTYYHRPGNWAEQPNFFNPYWRPRLAPVWQGVYSFPLINQLAGMLPSQLSNAPQKIMVH